jgi:hypothetical protein
LRSQSFWSLFIGCLAVLAFLIVKFAKKERTALLLTCSPRRNRIEGSIFWGTFFTFFIFLKHEFKVIIQVLAENIYGSLLEYILIRALTTFNCGDN